MTSGVRASSEQRDDVQISARIPRADLESLEAKARESDRTVSAELRRAIRAYLGAVQ